MNQRDWRWVSSSVRGTSHAVSGTECQDSHLCQEIGSKDGGILLLLVSDGAGSAKRSAVGSKLICETLRDQVSTYFLEEGSVSQINSRVVAGWIESFRNEVILLADAEGVSEREFACTLVGAIVGSSSSTFFQIGDGAVVFASNPGGPYTLVFWPERGEYENTTYFATQPNTIEQLQCTLLDETVLEIGILSDGLQRLALDYQTRQAHQPFFAGLFPTVRSTPKVDLIVMSEKLSAYLDSPKINDRTDDDKTLVLAVGE